MADADLLGLVELRRVRLVVRAHLVVGDVLGLDALFVLVLEEAADHELLLGAPHLGRLVEVLRVRLLGEQLEAHHLVEQLATALGAVVASREIRPLVGDRLGELADRDRVIADLRERLRRLLLGEAVHARLVRPAAAA